VLTWDFFESTNTSPDQKTGENLYRMSVSLSPARRVLADKTPNASIRRAHEPMPKPMSEEPKALMKHTFEMEVERNTTPKAGQKRRIHEVDGAEEQEEQGRDRAGLTPPLITLPTEPNSEANDREFLSTSQTKTTTSTLLTSFHASQELPMPLEDQFDIQDEMSQRTLDKLVSRPIGESSGMKARLACAKLFPYLRRDWRTDLPYSMPHQYQIIPLSFNQHFHLPSWPRLLKTVCGCQVSSTSNRMIQ
jgi:hypothetical protein